MKRTPFLMLASVLVATGCTSTVQQSDGTSIAFTKVKGEMTSTLGASLPRVETATHAAFEELRLVGADGAVDGLRGRLTARMADGTRVSVRIKALDFESTSVRIKVGTTGNRAISLQLLRHIQRQLEESD